MASFAWRETTLFLNTFDNGKKYSVGEEQIFLILFVLVELVLEVGNLIVPGVLLVLELQSLFERIEDVPVFLDESSDAVIVLVVPFAQVYLILQTLYYG